MTPRNFYLNLKDIFLIPNLITLSRLFASIYLFVRHAFNDFSTINLVLVISFIGISDSIDGVVARKFNLVSKLGTILDPVCDRIVFVLILFWLRPVFPIWFFYGILFRELLVMIGSFDVLRKTKTLKVSNFGKFGTVLIFVSLCFYVLNHSNETIFFIYFGGFALIFYYFVALEYFFKIYIEK